MGFFLFPPTEQKTCIWRWLKTLNCSVVWYVWESSKRLAFVAHIGSCFNAPTMNSDNSSKRFDLKLKHQHHIGFLLLEIRDHKHGVSTVSLRTRTMCAELKWWKWTFFWAFLFLAIYLPFLPLSLSCVPVRVCVGLRASVRVSHRWVLPGKVQTGHARAGSEALVFLGRHGRVSSTHAHTWTERHIKSPVTAIKTQRTSDFMTLVKQFCQQKAVV